MRHDFLLLLLALVLVTICGRLLISFGPWGWAGCCTILYMTNLLRD